MLSKLKGFFKCSAVKYFCLTTETVRHHPLPETTRFNTLRRQIITWLSSNNDVCRRNSNNLFYILFVQCNVMTTRTKEGMVCEWSEKSVVEISAGIHGQQTEAHKTYWWNFYPRQVEHTLPIVDSHECISTANLPAGTVILYLWNNFLKSFHAVSLHTIAKLNDDAWRQWQWRLL